MLFVVPSEVRVRCAGLIALCGGLLALSPFSSLAGNITLAWDPGIDPSVAGYNLYYGPSSRNYTNSVLAGSATTVTVSNLAAGFTYYFAATAYDTNGIESDYSSEVTGLVSAPNQPPTLNTLANVTINENAGLQTVALSGIGSGAANESQTLTVTAVSSNPGLIPNPAVAYTSPNATGSLTFTPVASAFGSATLTVTVNDGGTSNNIVSRTFTVTVNQVNQLPTISAISNRVIAVNTATPLIIFTVGDLETPVSSLTVSGSSDNTTLVPNANIIFGGSNTNRNVRVTPAAGQTGVAQITITVSDGSATASSAFQLVVRPKPLPPLNLHVVSQ